MSELMLLTDKAIAKLPFARDRREKSWLSMLLDWLGVGLSFAFLVQRRIGTVSPMLIPQIWHSIAAINMV
jgi:hypothetical protein